MRRILLCVFVGLVLAVCVAINGCDDSSLQGGYIESDTIIPPEEYCPEYSYKAVISGDAGDGAYIWLALLDQDTLLVHGEPVHVTGNYSDVELSLWVGVWNHIPSGTYYLRVLASADVAEVGSVTSRTMAAEVQVIDFEYLGDSENHQCCTPVLNGADRMYVYFVQYDSNFTGASATIKARYGLPCGYPDSGNTTHNVTYAGVSYSYPNPQGPILIWGQVGVGWERFPAKHNDEEIWRFIYGECWGASGLQQMLFYDDEQEGAYDQVRPPDDGIAWTYACWVDTLAGQWYFTIDNVGFYADTTDDAWYVSGDNVVWVSEIMHVETDMAGTADNPCLIYNMLTTLDTWTWHEVDYSYKETLQSDNWSFWYIERTPNGDTLKLWDQDPIP